MSKYKAIAEKIVVIAGGVYVCYKATLFMLSLPYFFYAKDVISVFKHIK